MVDFKEALTHRYGPLPAWGWGVGAVALVGGVLYLRAHTGGATAATNALPADTSTAGSGGGAGPTPAAAYAPQGLASSGMVADTGAASPNTVDYGAQFASLLNAFQQLYAQAKAKTSQTVNVSKDMVGTSKTLVPLPAATPGGGPTAGPTMVNSPLNPTLVALPPNLRGPANTSGQAIYSPDTTVAPLSSADLLQRLRSNLAPGEAALTNEQINQVSETGTFTGPVGTVVSQLNPVPVSSSGANTTVTR